MNAIIIDDEADAISALKTLLTEYCPEINIVGTATAVLQGIKEILAKKPELVFLDIELGDGTGFDVLDSLPEQSFKVIFTTAYNRYALKAIKSRALEYLLKPINCNELVAAVEKAGQQLVPPNIPLQFLRSQLLRDDSFHTLVLPASRGFSVVEIKNILYCKAEGSYVKFFFTGGKSLMVSRQLKEYEGLLELHGFFRIHHSFLVNLQLIEEYINADGGYIRMKNGATLPVSTRKNEALLQKMALLSNPVEAVLQ